MRNFAKKHYKTIVAYVFVVFFILVWTRLDWVSHTDTYQQPNGFTPTDQWLNNYWIPYGLQYLGLGLAFFTISRSWKHTVPLLVFFSTFGQDLIYYLWGGFAYPINQWDWMIWYKLFGSWTTSMQFTWSLGLTTISVLVVNSLSKKSLKHIFYMKTFCKIKMYKRDNPVTCN